MNANKVQLKKHRTCGDKDCSVAWRKQTKNGKNNQNYKTVEELKKQSTRRNGHGKMSNIISACRQRIF